MKAKIWAIVCVLLVLCMGSVFAQDSIDFSDLTIDEFLEAYEDFVIDVEIAAEEGDGSAYYEFLEDYTEFVEFCDQIDASNWTVEQLQFFNDLTLRYTAAATELANYVSYDDILSAYGTYGF
ncbi:MAG: hypothetical protein K5930_12545 [Treponemataceae bacterium]|nr:hypothetical protein [Treponemataceae bacterium]